MKTFKEYINEAKVSKRLETEMNRFYFQVLHDQMGKLVKITKKIERGAPSNFTVAEVAAFKATGRTDGYGISGSDLIKGYDDSAVVLKNATGGSYTIEDWIAAIKKEQNN